MTALQRTADFEYPLPEDRIALVAAEPRDHARLLVDRGALQAPDDRFVVDLPVFLEPGDLVVVNRTRVLPARLALTKESGGAVEVLLLERRGSTTWEALVRPGRRVPDGTVLTDSAGIIQVIVGADLGEGVRLVDIGPGPSVSQETLSTPPDLVGLICDVGRLPLPPYLERAVLGDPERYQTIFSFDQAPVSSAAPTAGLHLTRDLVESLATAGMDVVAIDLAVGLGTFRPITAENVADHPMHAEYYRVEPDIWTRIEEARRVVAVGTTTVRTLETVGRTGELEGHTELFIHGDFDFRVVDLLMTNFHQPRSSLLVMIEAFTGPRWRDLYGHALRGDYRFLSLGDAMLLSRKDHWGES